MARRYFLYRWFLPLLVAGLPARCWGGTPQEAAAGEAIMVVGWPMRTLDREKPPAWLGDDPVLGRLMCPPFSRLNLLRKKSEALIFQDALVQKDAAGKTTWTFVVRSGIFWWNGKAVTTSDLADFIRTTLPQLVKERGYEAWPLPAYTINTLDHQVVVSWQEPPAIGPFLFNGATFWRTASAESQKQTGLAYECAGIYQAKIARQGIALSPVAGYTMRRQPLILTDRLSGQSLPKAKTKLEFVMAESFAVHPAKRSPAQPAACGRPIDLPLLSVVSWNTQRGPTSDARLRAVLTGLTPRGALLRAGAGHAGDLLASLLPRNHPGFNSKLALRPFHLSDTARALDLLGFTRPQGDKDRLDLAGKPLTLTLASIADKPGLVEKVLTDSLMAVGIHSKFLPVAAAPQELDGVVSGVFLPWPGMNLLNNFHSKATDTFPFWRLNDKALDQELEAYALTVTQQIPDFQPLQRIHALLYQFEPLTVLLQHRACLEVTGRGAGQVSAQGHIDVRDPDWFRKLIL